MDTLFDNSDEYPDYVPLPRFTASINGVVVPLAVAGSLLGVCPVVLQEHGHSPHTPHHDYQPVNLPSPAWSVSSTTTSTSITPPTGRLSFGGHAPTIKIG
jgi:hypothetical protein